MSTIKSSAENLTLNADGAGNDIIIQSNASTKLTVDGATGNLGIGTTTPSQKLDITGNIAVSGTVDGIDIATRDAILTSTTTTAGAALPKAGGTMTGALVGTSGTFSGNVTATGLGKFNTTSYTPVTNGEKVSIEGTSAWQQSLSFSMWGAGTYNSSYASGAIGVANSNSKIHISGGAQVVGNPAGSSWAKTLSATSASFNVLGNGQSSWYTDTGLTANTAYTPTERVRIHNNGVTSFNNGVALGAGLANTAANTLDDYEEGTWTPADDSGAGLTFQISSANYTKVGRIVNINCYIVVPTNSSTAQLVITGLPFNAIGGNAYFPSILNHNRNAPAGSSARVGTGTNRVYGITQTNTNVTNQNLSNSIVIFQLTYITA